MNKKIYFHNRSVLLTDEKIQPSDNQLIVDTIKNSDIRPSEKVLEFIQQPAQNDLVLLCKNVDQIFKQLKDDFAFIEAAGGLIRQKDRYLFIFRLKKWDLPKGKLDKGEKPDEAALRECQEECGITGLQITKELPSTYHIYQYKSGFALKITYWFAMTSTHKGELIPQTEEDIEKAEWLDVADIKKNVLADTYPAIADLVREQLIANSE